MYTLMDTQGACNCNITSEWAMRITGYSTTRNSLTSCIPGDWSCQCSGYGYGDVSMIYM
jgi:hypothetical protein